MGFSTQFRRLPALANSSSLSAEEIVAKFTGTPDGTKFLRDDGTLASGSGSTNASDLTSGTLAAARLPGVLADVDTAAELRAAAQLATGDSPQFTAINLGHASDTTLARSSAGVITVEGVTVALGSGTSSQVLLGTGAPGNVPDAALPQSIATGASPQFAGINLGHASDTTITRVSAGVIAVEGATVRTGTVGLSVGGTGVDLSATGGATHVLAQAADHTISARALIAADIPALDAAKITTGTIDSARLPALSANAVVVQASITAYQGLSSGADNLIEFNQHDLITDATLHSTSSNKSRFVAPTGLGGKYKLTVCLPVENSSGAFCTYTLKWLKNGSVVRTVKDGQANGGNEHLITASYDFALADGDYAEFAINPNQASNYVAFGADGTASVICATASFERIGN